MSKPKIIIAFKMTRPNGTDFRTGTINYAEALRTGKPVEVLDATISDNPCGHGIHVSPTARKTIQFGNRSHRPWRWFQGEINFADIMAKDDEKYRVKRFKVVSELTLADIFGTDLAERVQAVHESILTWKTIPWFKSPKTVKEKTIAKLVSEWREALQPWASAKLPTGVRIVTTRAADDGAAAYDADAAEAAADASANAAEAANAAAYCASANAYSESVVAAYAADADYADAADDNDGFFWRLRWYVRPCYVLRRYAYWQIAGMLTPNPWKPLVELYRMGCVPIGFSGNKFVVYVPKVKAKKKS